MLWLQRWCMGNHRWLHWPVCSGVAPPSSSAAGAVVSATEVDVLTAGGGKTVGVGRIVGVGIGGNMWGGAPIEGIDRVSVVVKTEPMRVVWTCRTDSSSCKMQHIHQQWLLLCTLPVCAIAMVCNNAQIQYRPEVKSEQNVTLLVLWSNADFTDTHVQD